MMQHFIKQKEEKEQKFLQRIEVIQKHYEDTKKKLLYLREDNRILKIRMENEQGEYSEDELGNVVPKSRIKRNFKHRTPGDIEREMALDPIVKLGNDLENTKEEQNFVDKIAAHE
jgi:hypothetical protein